ncbi:MAG: thioesterase family protein [Acidobacteriota bacterium]
MAGAAASLDLFRVWCPIRIAWGDMDAYGHVNNARYFTFCESARMSYFERVELDTDRQHSSCGPALVQADLNFRQQVHYPAELRAGARCTRLGTKSFALAYTVVHAESDEIVADGSSVVAWVDYAKSRAEALPTDLRQRIEALDAASLTPADI